MGQYRNLEINGAQLSVYVEYPPSLPAPVVVVLHEVFGVNNDMRTSCQELANRGFIAIAPDLFWRQEPGIDLSHWTPGEWEKGLTLYKAYDRDQGASDIDRVIQYSKSIHGSTGKVAVMGYCLGGLMTYLVSARFAVDASIAYYPGSAEHYLEEADSVANPMLVHLAEEDEFISKDAQAEIYKAFSIKPNIKVFSYAGCSHAFARHTGTHYDESAAALANGRTWDFLDACLK
ncbi:MAG TPA: dienelactone hydrolase family protein [Rheinheimera sp.]|uniref:dienelactone hydrolase family protein n=1 Tax=Rheinheimera sp. TaxID=1869214 RepID=UPI002B485351|nr:dienelactone hydrolase family protein [Rheinheimera sp.]HJS13779.1 dienelactone hydrolase family protein [Rheinheimera sp.]